MFRLKSNRVAIAMLCSLFLIGFIVQSDAASASLSVWADDDLGGGGSTQAWLTADEGIDFIDWYIKDGPDSDYEYEKTTMHNGATSAYEYLGNFTGNIKGKKYGVRAVVSFEESSDEDAYDTFKVCKPEEASNNGLGTKTGAYGYAYVSCFYYDGSSVVMSASAYATNPTNNPKAKDPDDNPLKVAVWFRTNQFTGINGREIQPERRDTKPTETVEVGNSSEYYTPNGMIVDRWVGTLAKGDKYYFLAHTHVRVFTVKGNHKEDNWEADTEVQEFTWRDNW